MMFPTDSDFPTPDGSMPAPEAGGPDRRLRRTPGRRPQAQPEANDGLGLSSMPLLHASGGEDCTNAAGPAFSFPSGADVAAVGSAYGGAPAVSAFRLRVTPGTVALASSAAEHAVADDGSLLAVDGETGEVLDGDGGVRSGSSEVADGPAGVIRGWSTRSRARMVSAFAGVDVSPLFAGSAGWPVMVTLTLPCCWVRVAPTAADFQAAFRRFQMRYVRAWGDFRCLWKLEFQSRHPEARCSCEYCAGVDDGRAPHLHLFIAEPAGLSMGRQQLPFREWLSLAWADSVAHPDPGQRAAHIRAGTGVDLPSGLRARDPRRLAVYFSKHSGAGGMKEYQHRIPKCWPKGGRFWGIIGLDRPSLDVLLTEDEFIQVRRILRRWSRSMVFYGDSVTTIRPRTRVVSRLRGRRYRRTRVRAQLFIASRLIGGTAVVGDGPAMARVLAQAVQAVRSEA